MAFAQDVRYDSRWIWTRTIGYRVSKEPARSIHTCQAPPRRRQVPVRLHRAVGAASAKASARQKPAIAVIHPVPERATTKADATARRHRTPPAGIRRSRATSPEKESLFPRPAGPLPTRLHRQHAARSAWREDVCPRRLATSPALRTVDPFGLDGIDGEPAAVSPQRRRARAALTRCARRRRPRAPT